MLNGLIIIMACHVFRLYLEAMASRCRLSLQIFWVRHCEQQRGIPIASGMCMRLKSPRCKRLVCYDIQGGIPDFVKFYSLVWNTDSSIRFLIWKVLLWVSEIKYKGVDWVWHTCCIHQRNDADWTYLTYCLVRAWIQPRYLEGARGVWWLYSVTFRLQFIVFTNN
jgi:hypothetical protein